VTSFTMSGSAVPDEALCRSNEAVASESVVCFEGSVKKATTAKAVIKIMKNMLTSVTINSQTVFEYGSAEAGS